MMILLPLMSVMLLVTSRSAKAGVSSVAFSRMSLMLSKSACSRVVFSVFKQIPTLKVGVGGSCSSPSE